VIEDFLTNRKRACEKALGLSGPTHQNVHTAEVVQQMTLADHVAAAGDHPEHIRQDLLRLGQFPALLVYLSDPLQRTGLAPEISAPAVNLQRLFQLCEDTAETTLAEPDVGALRQHGSPAHVVVGPVEVPPGLLVKEQCLFVIPLDTFQEGEVPPAQGKALGVRQLLEQLLRLGQRGAGFVELAPVEVEGAQ
jgi:hypothetical protein